MSFVEEIIHAYFGPEGDEENPRCPECGEVLEFEREGERRLRVRCPECAFGFCWDPPPPPSPWSPLHLGYFLECRKLDQPPRCPYDDCYVLAAEFNDGAVEFRCPCCSRVGRSSPASQ